jgi:hypothetical protein
MFPLLAIRLSCFTPPFLQSLQEGDILFLDGGFKLASRTSGKRETWNTQRVIIVQTPPLKKGNQLSAQDADKKQIADSIRTVIENVFGR